MFYDLNIKVNPQKPFAQKEIIQSCIEDGYSGVAFNYEFVGALTPQNVCTFKKFDVSELMSKDANLFAKPELRRVYENFRQYSRITLTVNETRQITQVAKDNNTIVQSYDIVAVKTNNQKIFYSLCLENETVDIISFDLNERLPYHLKRGPVTEAIKKGIMFEITYSQAIEDSATRRLIFSNALQLIRATKGKNIIISSGAEDAFYHRGPYDAINLASLFELQKELAYKAVADNTEKCVKRAEFRKNYKGTVSMASAEDLEKFMQKEAKYRALKQLKTETLPHHQQNQTEMEEEGKVDASQTHDHIKEDVNKNQISNENREQSGWGQINANIPGNLMEGGIIGEGVNTSWANQNNRTIIQTIGNSDENQITTDKTMEEEF